MHTSFWSVKGGVGVSTIATLHALAVSGRAEATLLVDPVGDQPALLGIDEPTGPGIADWASSSQDPAALDRITTTVTNDLALLHRGGTWQTDAAALAEALRSGAGRVSRRTVIVDCGLADNPATRSLLDSARQRLLVLRPCYLALRAARDLDPTPTGVIVVRERGRALGLADVEAVTETPVIADIAYDIAIARAIDAGLLAARIPRALRRTMELSHVVAA